MDAKYANDTAESSLATAISTLEIKISMCPHLFQTWTQGCADNHQFVMPSYWIMWMEK